MEKNTELKEGQIVRNFGYEFIARNVRFEKENLYGERVWTYDGECTENPCNDSIQKTPSNGARYSWRASDK